MSIPVTIVGRIGQPPELKFGSSGKAIARFSVVTSRRVLDKTSNEWSDTDTTWWNCTAFGDLAENVAESCEKGCAVIVTGRAASETWNDKNTGEKRTAMKVIADEVAPSLRFATAKITKANRGGGGGNSGGGQPQSQGQPSGNRSGQQQNTGGGGWGGGNGGGGWGAGGDTEPPF
ncbi:single-strand binding protein [Catenulispora acidiphila DSM 44928]|uniref:Single-stranded DNA-binding protein n=1 Tax=Catenulispora acidiphila (strain DSM 44928 / JCM 14897 / NBRC 102108 / NRRL B-24433 / ID139908) TaxID=479433 RepID=C7Q4G0_CATAD|nr:single-stranded DNA-binding protein [Catenulispora acidiphila]ACU71929.1 single-strand binding protein [Catenulispora acidiphila DSM 44928]